MSTEGSVLPKAPARKVPRSIYEGARDMARDIANSDEGRTSRRERKKVEMLFAHLKRALPARAGRPSRHLPFPGRSSCTRPQ
jgi:hypothetical protein